MKIVGWLAMIAAVVAIVVGVGAAVGIWVVRPQIEDRVAGLLVAADDGLTKSAVLLDRVDAGVTTASGAVIKINDLAQARAADPLIDDQTRTDLATQIDDVMTGPYAKLQTGYVGLRERVQSLSRTLRVAGRLVPGIDLPDNLADSLTKLDEAVTKLDDTVTGGASLLTDVLTGPNPSSRVAEQTQKLTDALVIVGDLLPKVDQRLTQAQERVVHAQEQLSTWMLALAVVVTLIGLYLAALNVLLFQKGREWVRRSEAPVAA